jgi:hypothetical protein
LLVSLEQAEGDAVKSILGIILPVSLGVGTILAQISPTSLVLLPEPSSATSVSAPLPSPAEPVLRYVPGSSIKVEQLLGEEDKQLHQPTLSQTASRYGIEGTDLGSSFEYAGRVFFLFGDTVGRLSRALDTIGQPMPLIRRAAFDWNSSKPATVI